MSKYKKLMAKKDGVEIHKNFLESQKLWIEQHNKNPNGKMGLKAKDELQLVHKSLQMESFRSGQFSAPKKQFITAEAWDETIDGKYDPAKVVERKVFGQVRKGIFKNVGREGVFDHDEYDGTTHKEITTEEAGEGPLVTQAIAAKSEVILASFDAESAQRSAKAVEATPPVDMRALLRLIGEDKSAVSDQGTVSDQAAAEHTAPEGSTDSESASEDSGIDNRLSGYFATALPTGSATAKTKIEKKLPKTGGKAKVGAAAPSAALPPLWANRVRSQNRPGVIDLDNSQRPAASGQTTAASGQTIAA
jgi:hypothetical protein